MKMTSQKLTAVYFVLPLLAALCLYPGISAAVALGLGIATALELGNPYPERTRKLTSTLLGLSVMGLGAGMNLNTVATVGLSGFGYTVIGIFTTLVLGQILGRLLENEKDTSLLITVGTAICGGSAIAAVAPTIRAKPQEISVALGTVFILNAVALILFPPIGHFFKLSETQFGLWCALAIHDTSSVVGATLQYGTHALEVGTTVKLARALWIVPITFLIGWGRASRRSEKEGAVSPSKRPWFILGFLIIAAIVTWIPSLRSMGHAIEWISRRLLVLTLFLLGTNLTKETLRAVGLRPFIQGATLWILVASATFVFIYVDWIH